VSAYYNENDPKIVAWLKELISQCIIAPGIVDERSITDVRQEDLSGFVQCHFFAGIGGWSYALRLAGWPDDQPVWTGSCPCQPFSGAGKKLGEKDPRHLWPEFKRCISHCSPSVVFGEQVASKDGRHWLARIRTDLEEMDYAVGAADLCAAGVGAPHIRQRLYWVADAGHQQTWRSSGSSEAEGWRAFGDVAGCGSTGGMAHAMPTGRTEGRAESRNGSPSGGGSIGGMEFTESEQVGLPRQPWEQRNTTFGLGNTNNEGSQGRIQCLGREGELSSWSSSPWSNFDIIHCLDGKARRIEPGSSPLAHGVPARVGRLRGYGNAIVPQVASEFIKSYLEVI
jgi:DNA (cytosine-5)-methyltransferase 1